MPIANLPKLTGYSEQSANRGTRQILQVGEKDKMPTCKNVFSKLFLSFIVQTDWSHDSHFMLDRKIHSSLSSESLYG